MAEDKSKDKAKSTIGFKKLNNMFFNLLNDTRTNANKDSLSRSKTLTGMNDEIETLLQNEISSMKDTTGQDIGSFLYKVINDQDNKFDKSVKQVDDLFNGENSNAIVNFFHERYKDRNLLYEDLNLISDQLFQLNEAVMATRDAVITSDDMSQIISRQIDFENLSASDEVKPSYITMIKGMEADHKLLLKLKEHVIPKTLTYGEYYVYAIPYSKLFENYAKKKQMDIEKGKMGGATESVEFITESDISNLKSAHNITGSFKTKEIVNEINTKFNKIEIDNDELGIPVTEGVDLSAISGKDFDKVVKKHTKVDKNLSKPLSIDGVAEIDNTDFENVSGCYVKLLDPRKVVPVKILDTVLGYYYLHEAPMKIKTTFTTNISIGPSTNQFLSKGSTQFEHDFLTHITDKIVKKFNKPFLDNNLEFKELIMSSLKYNEIYKKDIKYEFIPNAYITSFKVKEDELGRGNSILDKSLFYAKLYLSLLIFKMLAIITRSTDSRMYYIKQSGFDQNISNNIQSVARSIKEKQLNFMDLLSYQSIVSKVGHMKDIFLPVGASADRGIEFDIMQGQDIPLNTDLMEMLERSAISSTGVPSVIMNHVNEADYAKSLVMANSKFLGRVVNHQLSFNESMTELYRKMAGFCTTIPPEHIKKLKVMLNPPRTLNTMNMNDLINNSDQIINFMVDAIMGKNANPGEDGDLIKDIIYRKTSKDVLPMLPWGRIEELVQEAIIESKEEKARKKITEEPEQE